MYKIKFILYCILNIWHISNFEDKSVNSIIFFFAKGYGDDFASF